MKKGVFASLGHTVSTNNEPCHHLCPSGKESRCRYQRSVSRREAFQRHKLEFTPVTADQLRPLYERLMSPDLLQHCVRMATQNANESFNAQIWLPSSLHTIQTAVAMAAIEWDAGPAGFNKIRPIWMSSLACTQFSMLMRLWQSAKRTLPKLPAKMPARATNDASSKKPSSLMLKWKRRVSHTPLLLLMINWCSYNLLFIFFFTYLT